MRRDGSAPVDPRAGTANPQFPGCARGKFSGSESRGYAVNRRFAPVGRVAYQFSVPQSLGNVHEERGEYYLVSTT